MINGSHLVQIPIYIYIYIYIYTHKHTNFLPHKNTIDVHYKDHPNNVLRNKSDVLVKYRFSAGVTYIYHRALMVSIFAAFWQVTRDS